MNFENPLITFIVATFNSGNTLEETIISILNQSYSNIELIIIDGLSSDNTQEIIEKYKHKISYWVSEKDNGIADAFNKGVKASKGDYINFQGAGDVLNECNVISEIFENKHIKSDFVIGRINRVEANNIKNILWVSKKNKTKFNLNTLVWKMSLYHQGLFTNKLYFKNYGLFDENLRYSMDYEHVLRSFKYTPSIYTTNVIVSNWRNDGIGENQESNIFKEYDKIKRLHKIRPHFQLIIINKFIIIKYYLKKYLKLTYFWIIKSV
jgi:glycosyltransferase involved in cell wall biosynthesis